MLNLPRILLTFTNEMLIFLKENSLKYVSFSVHMFVH